MKREPISKRRDVSVGQIAAAIASAPDQVDDPDCNYDPNNPTSVQAYWKNAVPVFPGQHRFQHGQQQSGNAVSEKTIAQKMYVHKAASIAVLNGEVGNGALLPGLPAGKFAAAGTPAELVLLFATTQHELETLLPQAKRRMAPKAALWVAYLKGASKRKTDIDRDTIRDYAATLGLDSVAIIAIDDDWSALRLKQV
jgi:hypothetical protein